MSAVDIALVTLVLLLVALPGWALVRRLAPLRSDAEAFVLGAVLGIAGHAALGVFLPSLLGFPLAGADLVVGLALLAGGPRIRVPRIRGRRWLELAAVLVVASSFLPLVLGNAAPRGWDPSFHTLLVQRIAATGELPRTWEPWEPVAVHYTLGFHALVAHVARVTRLPAHVAFQGGFPFAYALLAASGLFLVRGLTRGRLRAVFATLALGLLAARIRLIYFWGGLPTVLGLALALGAAHALTRVPGRRGLILGGTILGALPYLHHLSALIAWSVFLAVGLVLVASPTTARRATRPAGLRALLALGLGAVLALPLAPRILDAASARDSTSIFRFGDEPELPLGDYALGWGHALTLLALVGGVALFLRPRRSPATRPGTLAALAFLAGMHVLLDVVYREVMRRRTGEDFSALTPSRWFAFASVPLALLAAEGAALLVARRRHARRAAPFVALALVGLALPGYVKVEYGSRSIDPSIADVASWVRGQVPETSLVVVRARSFVLTGRPKPGEEGLLPSRHWWPYFLGLETDETPLPASEPRLDPRVRAKKAMRDDPEAARAIAKARGKRLYWLGPAALPPPPGAVRLGTYANLVALDEAR